LNGPNNREIHQSGLSASGHGFERFAYRAVSIRCFRCRFCYKISDVKQWLPSL